MLSEHWIVESVDPDCYRPYEDFYFGTSKSWTKCKTVDEVLSVVNHDRYAKYIKIRLVQE